MSAVFEAWQLPRGNIVVRIEDGDRKHAEVVTECFTFAEAEVEAAARNTDAWLAEKPGGAEAMVWGDDWEGRLLAILDKPLELELLAAA
jgi:hypothetical protein